LDRDVPFESDPSYSLAMLMQGEDGVTYAYMACPTCDNLGPHAPYENREGSFQCDRCFMGFTYDAML
jgi:hypothetical protein